MPIVRKGLKETLEEELGKVRFWRGRQQPGSAGTIWKGKWDLVMLDINMEQRSGLEVLAEIRKARPKLPVLILSMYPVEEFGVRALNWELPATSTSKARPRNWSRRCRTSSRADATSARPWPTGWADLQRGAQSPFHETLSTREYQVMLMIAGGKSLKEIAAELSISAKTVGTYHTRILAKMGMKTTSRSPATRSSTSWWNKPLRLICGHRLLIIRQTRPSAWEYFSRKTAKLGRNEHLQVV